MSNYTKATNFAIKDSLVTGNPAKIIKAYATVEELETVAKYMRNKG